MELGVIILQLECILHGAMPALDLVLHRWVIRSPADMLDMPALEEFLQIIRDLEFRQKFGRLAIRA